MRTSGTLANLPPNLVEPPILIYHEARVVGDHKLDTIAVKAALQQGQGQGPGWQVYQSSTRVANVFVFRFAGVDGSTSGRTAPFCRVVVCNGGLDDVWTTARST